MKKIVLLLLFLFSCDKNNVEWSNKNIEYILKTDRNKSLMIYFYADWWGPCKMLDANTYSNNSVIDYIHNTFIPFKINAESKQGNT